MKLDLQALAPFARDAATALFEQRPTWRDLASLGRSLRSGSDHELRVCLACPNPRLPGEGLILFADDHEFTVEFGPFHTHFDELSEALAWMNKVMEEQVLIGFASLKGSVRIGTTLIPGDDDDWLDLITAPNGCDQFFARSWRGTFDRDWP